MSPEAAANAAVLGGGPMRGEASWKLRPPLVERSTVLAVPVGQWAHTTGGCGSWNEHTTPTPPG